MQLAITQQWNESFGYCDIQMNPEFNYNENNLSKYINYLKRKNFVTYLWNRDDDGVEQTLLDFMTLYKYLNTVRLRVPVRRARNNHQHKYHIYIVRNYRFADRDFCSINQHFELFISKCKKYYSQKINFYNKMKSPKLILNRQYGNRFKFYFNNV